MTEELKPCPLCGSEARVGQVTEGGEANPDFGGYFVQCGNEACHGCMGLRFACGDDPRPELITAWNTRLSHSRETEALIEALEPFAQFAERIPDSFANATNLWNSAWSDKPIATVADFRRARSTLLSMRNNGNG